MTLKPCPGCGNTVSSSFTPTDDGYTIRNCYNCGRSYVDSIPAAPVAGSEKIYNLDGIHYICIENEVIGKLQARCAELERERDEAFVKGARAMHNAIRKCRVIERKFKGGLECGYDMGEVDGLTVEYLNFKENKKGV
jgi:hypothetical protein